MVDWGSTFYDHFAKFFREPFKRGIYRKNKEGESIQILHYKNVFEGCMVFTSLGLSRYADILGIVAEVCLVTDCAFDESESIFANTLFYLVDNRINLGRGVSISGISNINKEFSRLYDKNALYFTLPYAFPAGYEKVRSEETMINGNIYQAFFISQKEHEFFLSKGAEAFESILEDKNIDPFALKRVSAV